MNESDNFLRGLTMSEQLKLYREDEIAEVPSIDVNLHTTRWNNKKNWICKTVGKKFFTVLEYEKLDTDQENKPLVRNINCQIAVDDFQRLSNGKELTEKHLMVKDLKQNNGFKLLRMESLLAIKFKGVIFNFPNNEVS